MAYKKILTIQDISCVGQCSLTVALPIISACGIETCILPSAVLSTHTAGFTGYTFRDLTDDIPKIVDHWKKEGIKFSAIYTGYLGSNRQIAIVRDILRDMGEVDHVSIVDPAMADGGKLYPAFDRDYVEAMKELCGDADILLPNITEACFLTDTEYRESYDEGYIALLFDRLTKLGAKSVVLTGVGYRVGKTGVAVYDGTNVNYYEHDKMERGSHGTGDIYASAFTGAYVRGKDLFESAKIAADFTLQCIKNSQGDDNHTYGAKFETAIPDLIEMVK